MNKICDRCGSDKDVKYTISMPCSNEHWKILYICEKCNTELLDFVKNKYSYKKVKEIKIMTKQDIEFIKTQIENINFETPSMPLSEWEVWTSGAVTMYSAIMDMLYDLNMDTLYDSQIHHIKYGEKQKETQEWIPITEGLPKKSGDYLVTVYKDLREVYTDRYDSVLKTFNAYIPIAWMPLPKPYKGENKNVD